MDGYGMKCEHTGLFNVYTSEAINYAKIALFFFRNDPVFPPAVLHSCPLMTQSPWQGI